MDSTDPDLRVLTEHLVRAISNPIEETPPLSEIGVSWLKKTKSWYPATEASALSSKPDLNLASSQIANAPTIPAPSNTEKSTKAPITALALAPDHKRIAVGNQDGLVMVMDQGGKRILAKMSDHRLQVNALTFSSNGQFVYSAGMDRLVCAFQWVLQETPWRFYAHEHSTTCLATDRMGAFLVSGGGDGTITLRNLETLKDSEPLKAHKGRISSCVFLDDFLVTAGLDDGKVATWQTRGLTPLAKSDFHGDCIIDMDANQFAKIIAVSTSSRRIGFFETNTLKRGALKIDTKVTVQTLRLSPKGTYIAGGCADGSVRIWNTKSGKLVGNMMVHHKKSIRAVMWLPGGGSLLVGTAEGEVKRYTLAWLMFCALFRPKDVDQPRNRDF
jgi:WD40 repeat protein